MTTQSLPYAHLGEALATDYFQVREQFTDEQWNYFITTRRFVCAGRSGRARSAGSLMQRHHSLQPRPRSRGRSSRPKRA